MNFLCNINQSFTDRSSCSEVFCKKGVLRNFAKFLRTHFLRIPFVAASERVNADEAAVFCSCWKENISGEAY